MVGSNPMTWFLRFVNDNKASIVVVTRGMASFKPKVKARNPIKP